MTQEDLKQRIEQLVEAHRDDIVAGLSALLKFRTVGGDPDVRAVEEFRSETARCLTFLEDLARRMGLDWRCYNNEFAVAALPYTGPFIALPVHVDVVPPGDGWARDPFGGEVVDGVVWGRGCQDDKGPVIQCLWAIQIIRELGAPLRRGARLVVGTAEEFGDWPDIRKYPAHEPEPEYTIVSDATFPIVNGEKGMLNLQVMADIPYDDEPVVGGFRLRSAWAGERANIVPPKAELRFEGDETSDASLLERELRGFLAKNTEARATLSRPADAPHDALIVFEGRSAHGSTPLEGHNAAVDMLRFMSESGFVSDDEADMANVLFELGNDTTGSELDVEGQHPVLGDTTSNLGLLRWKAGNIETVFNIRPTMGFTAESCFAAASARLQGFAEEFGFAITADAVAGVLDPIHLDPAEHPDFIAALQEAYTAVTGREATLHTIGGTTYSKAFPRAVCFGPLDPADEEDLVHKVDERISVEHLLRNVKIYAHALARLCTV